MTNHSQTLDAAVPPPPPASPEASAVCLFFADDAHAAAPMAPSGTSNSNSSAFYTLRRQFRLPGVADHGPAAEEAAQALRSALPEGELQPQPPVQPLFEGAFTFTLHAGARYGTAALAAVLASALNDRCARIPRFSRVARDALLEPRIHLFPAAAPFI